MQNNELDRVYAFTDEYGSFGWSIDNPDVSTHFIITAIIVRESDLDSYAQGAEQVRSNHFQTGEIKSSKVGKNHDRRIRILRDLGKLPFNFFAVCVDKKKCLENMSLKGLQYKASFYKFMNNIVHKELRKAFRKITIVSDEIGRNEYMESFCRYVEKHQDIPNLWGDADLTFQNSRQDVRVQVADFISGTLAYVYDTHKASTNHPDYLKILAHQMIRIQLYPVSFENYILDSSAIAEDYDRDIANVCFAQAVSFIKNHDNDEDTDVQAQIIVLKYMLFRFMNNSTRTYIYTSELKGQLAHTELNGISTAAFRMRIIGKLRDSGVIIASSQRGYKIPSKVSELYDFINHDASVVIPMLARLKKCRDLIKMSTTNKLDLLDHMEYQALKDFFDHTSFN